MVFTLSRGFITGTKNLIPILLSVVVVTICSQDKRLSATSKIGCEDTLKSKWATYEKLNSLIKDKKFKEIPQLFSKKYRQSAQDGIRDFREFWLQAWTMNNLKAMTKRLRLKKNPSLMVCEDGMWKINEQ